MRFVECQQGTAEWMQARAGRITASCFADAISVCTRVSGKRKVGDPTAVSDRYAADLAIERISGKPFGEPPKTWLLNRGHDLEFSARMAYEARTLVSVTEAGICLTDDEVFGYSTDGLVGDTGLIEIKCPIDSSKIIDIWRSGDVSEYMHQMQGGMWITGRQWCDFIMYVPDLGAAGKDLYVQRIARDDAFIDAMVDKLVLFAGTVNNCVALLRSTKAPAATPPAPASAPAVSDWKKRFLKTEA